ARRGDSLGPARGRCVGPSQVLPQLVECRLEQRLNLRVALPPGLGLALPTPGGPTSAGADLLVGVDRGLEAHRARPGGEHGAPAGARTPAGLATGGVSDRDMAEP